MFFFFFTWFARHLSEICLNFAKLRKPCKHRVSFPLSFFVQSRLSRSAAEIIKPHLQLKTTSAIIRAYAFFKYKINSAKLRRVYIHTPRCSCHRWLGTCKNDVRVYTPGLRVIILFITRCRPARNENISNFYYTAKHTEQTFVHAGSPCTWMLVRVRERARLVPRVE